MLKWARILIIEDELLVAWSLRDVLSLIGCEVTGIAATVSEALILAENTKPALFWSTCGWRARTMELRVWCFCGGSSACP